MELREALTQIALIREQMAQAELFRGYRWNVVAGSGALALVAAGVQWVWLPNPQANLGNYLLLWIAVAAVSAGGAALEIARKIVRGDAGASKHATRAAIEQFVPCLVAGALLTLVFARQTPENAWMLPGLWAVLFSMGAFASCRLLPRSVFWVGAYYLAGGCLYLALAAAAPDCRLAPWSMGLLFGGGQCLAGAVLYWSLERCDAEI